MEDDNFIQRYEFVHTIDTQDQRTADHNLYYTPTTRFFKNCCDIANLAARGGVSPRPTLQCNERISNCARPLAWCARVRRRDIMIWENFSDEYCVLCSPRLCYERD